MPVRSRAAAAIDAWEAFLRAHGVREAVLEPLSLR